MSESSCSCSCGCGHGSCKPDSLRPRVVRIAVALALFGIALALVEFGIASKWASLIGVSALAVEFALFLVPYLVAGYDVVLKAFRNIGHGRVFDENFLMTIATFGAFALVLFPESEPHMAEGAAVMLFYQVGELFQDYAVGKSRRSISEMMDIAPEYANVLRNGELVRVCPSSVMPGDEFVVKPGERVPLDGVIVAGSSQVDTSALTGESLPRDVEVGEELISGCINLSGSLAVQASALYEDSTVSRILEMVEKASDRKARTESFITRFARWYTPLVVVFALLLAVAPPLAFGLPWTDWVQRGLVFLVVSCPCALVISVPLSFFGGIGAASRMGVLVKGSNYLEALSQVDTVVFDKTGTLTTGRFNVVALEPVRGVGEDELLRLAAAVEAFSNHPIAVAIREECGGVAAGVAQAEQVEELGGYGVSAVIEGRKVLAGSERLMAAYGVEVSGLREPEQAGTVVYVAVDGAYAGCIRLGDAVKPDAQQAVSALRSAGAHRIVMLTGDRLSVAAGVARDLGISEVHAELLPQDKVAVVEQFLHSRSQGGKLAFVGDGINDAPVLMRADVGIAMGGMGSHAAIEAADVVIMDDRPASVARAMRVARRTVGIVKQNIVFALGVKFAVLLLAAFGVANLWLAVFADVGVAVLAILNAMRAMRV